MPIPVPLTDIDGIIRHMAVQESELLRLRIRGEIMRDALNRIVQLPHLEPGRRLADARGLAVTALLDVADA
jgi:hypothetical protein